MNNLFNLNKYAYFFNSLEMNCYLFKINGDEHAICPFCNYISRDPNYEEILQFDDYVDLPMIWCDECGARAFLDVSIDILHFLVRENPEDYLPEDRISDDEMKKLNDWILAHIVESKEVSHDLVSKITEKYHVEEVSQIRFFKVNVLYVKRVKNFMLLNYTAEHPISEETVNNLIQLNKDIYDLENLVDLSHLGIIKK
jgi:hypothetical protein